MSRIKTEYIKNKNGTTSIRLRYNGSRYTDIDGKVKMRFIGLDLNTQIYPFMRCTIGHFDDFEAN